MRIDVPDYSEVARSREFWDLAGGEGEDPCRRALRMIDRAIGCLKRHRAEIQSLRDHAHEWNEDDYCSICGADGRA